MPTFIKRNRIVSFRLSDEEYDRLEQISRAHGAHSVSDFVRITTHHAIAGSGQELARGWMKVNTVEDRIDALQQELNRLAGLIAEWKPDKVASD